MVKITNPEKEYTKTPKSFSEESRIVSVDKEEYNKGIILDSPEEFGQAIIVYNDGQVQSSKATENRLYSDIAQGEGIPGADTPELLKESTLQGSFMSMSMELLVPDGGSKFAQNLASEAIKDLKSKGRFHRDFDYDALGTKFFKTTISGNQIGEKYVLELNAAYVGDKPEGELAAVIKKPMALISSEAKGRLSIVDDWWFNLNLKDAVKNLPLSSKVLKNVGEWTKYLASGGYAGETPEFEFKHNGQKFALKLGLDVDRYLRPENGEYGSEYMQARGNSIVGGAWTTWAENGNDKIAPKAVQPSLVCYVSFPRKSYSKLPAVTPEEMEAVKSARDDLVKRLSK